MRSKKLSKSLIISIIIIASYWLWIAGARFFIKAANTGMYGCRSEGQDWGQEVKCVNTVLQQIYDVLYKSSFDTTLRALLLMIILIPALLIFFVKIFSEKHDRN